MLGENTRPFHRVVAVIALLQACVVVGGTLSVSVMLKAAGYGSGYVPDERFRSDSIFIRKYGFVMLLVPVAWALVTVHAESTSDDRKQGLVWLIVGCVML